MAAMATETNGWLAAANLLQPNTQTPQQPAIMYSYRHQGGSLAEWLACWTQAQKGPRSNRSRDAVG